MFLIDRCAGHISSLGAKTYSIFLCSAARGSLRDLALGSGVMNRDTHTSCVNRERGPGERAFQAERTPGTKAPRAW